MEIDIDIIFMILGMLLKCLNIFSLCLKLDTTNGHIT
jgi:hypothetical protein